MDPGERREHPVTKRLYTQNVAPTLSFAPTTKLGAWDLNTSTVLRALGEGKSGTNVTSSIADGTQPTDLWDVLLARYVADHDIIKKSGTLAGTMSICTPVLESSASANFFLHLHVYVLAGDTNTVRGALLSDYISSTEFVITTATAQLLSGLSISSLAVTAGDRIVVEIGYQTISQVSPATSYTGTVRYGGTGTSDLTAGSTSTSFPAWVEFSDTNGLLDKQTAVPSQDTSKAYVKGARWTGTPGGNSAIELPPAAAGEAQVMVQIVDDSLVLGGIPSGSGWTLVGSPASYTGVGKAQWYRRVAAGNVDAATETWTSVGGAAMFFALTLGNADATSDATLFDVLPAYQQNAASTTVTSPTVAPTGGRTDDLAITAMYSLVNYLGANRYAVPTNMTELCEGVDSYVLTYISGALDVQQLTTATATGTRTSVQDRSTTSIGTSAAIKTTITAVAPATVLGIGAGGSQLHALLQTPITDGAGSTLVKTLADLVAGYSNDPKFKSTADALWVHFEAALTDPLYAGAGSGARCELRETDASGTAYGFDATTGKHRLSGRSRIATIAASSDVGGTNGQGMVIAQCHNGTTDRITLRTQLISNQVKLLTRVNGTEAIRHSESYAANTQFEWALESDGNTVKIYYGAVGAMTLVYQSTPGVLVSTGSASWYFKAGVYNQITTGAGFNAVEHSLLTISHSDADATNLLYPFLHAGG